MPGKRIINPSLIHTTFNEAIANNALALVDWTGLYEARPIPIALLGNTYMQGSETGAVYRNEILPTDKYIRISVDGGVTWKILNVDNLANLHPPVSIAEGSTDYLSINKFQVLSFTPPSTVTADNALTKTEENIQFGASQVGDYSPLLHDTFVNSGPYYTKFIGANESINFGLSGVLKVLNTSQGRASTIESYGEGMWIVADKSNSGWDALKVEFGSGVGVYPSGTSGIGLLSSMTTGTPAVLLVANTSRGSIHKMLILDRQPSGGPAEAGMGGSIVYQFNTTDNTHVDAASIAAKWIDPILASKTSQIEIGTVNNGSSIIRKLAITGPGQMIFDEYGNGIFVGTLTKLLGTDVNGNVIEVDPSEIGSESTPDTITETTENVNNGTTHTHKLELDPIDVYGKLYGEVRYGYLYNVKATVATDGDILHGLYYNWYTTQGTGSSSVSSTDSFVVPTEAQINTLINYVGGKEVAGIKLRTVGYTTKQFCTYYPTWLNTPAPFYEGTDDYGFKAEASGCIRYQTPSSTYSSMSNNFYMWSCEDFGGTVPDSAKCFILRSNQQSVDTTSYFYDNTRYTTYKVNGCSIRLVNPNTTLSNGQKGIYVGNDGKVYPTICIGTQEWVQWNLAETKFRDGSLIFREENLTEWNTLTTPAYNYFGNKPENIYKTLRIVSSDDWHVADAYDYAAIGFANGGKLKRTGTTFWNTPNTGATNEYKFNAVGSGGRLYGEFSGINETSLFWTNDISLPIRSYVLSYNNSYLNQGNDLTLNNGHPLRLVKNSTTLINGQTGTYVGNDGKVYRTICIGTREWLADNLMETKYRNGDDIPGPNFTNEEWELLEDGAYCIYGDNPTNGGTEPIINPSVNVIEDITWNFNDITAGVAQTYTLDIKASFDYEILSTCLETDDGTLTGINITIEGVMITGLSSLTVDTTVDESLATGYNKVSTGNRVRINTTTGFTGVPTVLRGKLKIRRL